MTVTTIGNLQDSHIIEYYWRNLAKRGNIKKFMGLFK